MDIYVTIRKVSNGYIFESAHKTTKIFNRLEDVFEELLLEFEGLANTFNGDSYGKVIVRRGDRERRLDE